MKNFDFKKLVPHLVALGVFLLISVIFCKPALEPGTVLKQSDIAGWQGMSHQSYTYKEQHGHLPLWSVSMFSGMPAYQIAMEGDWSPVGFVDHIFQLWLPQPINFFFLACICFYFLCLTLRIRPYVAIVAALGYAYCSFSPIMVAAGHNTQMLAMAYAPAVIGSVILVFERKYLLGFALAGLFTALQIAQGHQQVSYYLFIVLALMTVSYFVHAYRSGQMLHFFKSIGMVALAGIIGVLANAMILFTTYDYSKASKRGGQLVMDEKSKDKVSGGKTEGLSKDYAFQWSYGIGETFTLMFPGVQGYGFHQSERDGDVYQFPTLPENAKSVEMLSERFGAGEQASAFASSNLYWGKQPFTVGPVYLGAVICLLFILGLFYLNNRHKWWILAATILGVVLAWGHNFPAFNYFMFDYFPLYNKFRVPTMALTIPQMVVPILAGLYLNSLDRDNTEAWVSFKKGIIAVAAVFVLALGFYATSDFANENRARTSAFNRLFEAKDPALQQKLYDMGDAMKSERDNQLYESMVNNFAAAPEPEKEARAFVSAIRQDRATVFLKDILRSFVFVLIAAGLIFLYLRRKINWLLLIAAVGILNAIDLVGFGTHFLNNTNYQGKDSYESNEFPMSAADQQILSDKDPNFRVFNTGGLEESKTSYYHKSIGGYHPAKLGIYDDLMAYQMNGQPNISVLNMLNAKYVIQQQGNQTVAMKNPGALGNVWFVKAVKFVNGPVEEMKALNNFNPADTAIVDQQYKSIVGNFTVGDSSDNIRQVKFDNDEIDYESNASTDRIAIFSEIYYKDWKAYIDGKPAEIFKANYVLRGLHVPAGKHTIQFKFEPASYRVGRMLSNVFCWVVVLLSGIALFFYARKKKTAA
jgi:hypothetical protein